MLLGDSVSESDYQSINSHRQWVVDKRDASPPRVNPAWSHANEVSLIFKLPAPSTHTAEHLHTDTALRLPQR